MRLFRPPWSILMYWTAWDRSTVQNSVFNLLKVMILGRNMFPSTLYGTGRCLLDDLMALGIWGFKEWSMEKCKCYTDQEKLRLFRRLFQYRGIYLELFYHFFNALGGFARFRQWPWQHVYGKFIDVNGTFFMCTKLLKTFIENFCTLMMQQMFDYFNDQIDFFCLQRLYSLRGLRKRKFYSVNYLFNTSVGMRE